MTTRVTLFVDPVSPWSYIAFVALRRYRQAWNLNLRVKPIFLGGVMNAAGNKPPISIPNKGKWMWEDLERISQQHGLTIKPVEKFPPSTLNIVRLLRVVRDKYPDRLEDALDKAFSALWQDQLIGPEQISALSPTPFSKSELDELVKLSASEENKAGVKADAEEVVQQGAFGFPFYVVERSDGEVGRFFGSDRLENMGWWLGQAKGAKQKYEWNGPMGPEAKSKL